jgi:hypothetical protein
MKGGELFLWLVPLHQNPLVLRGGCNGKKAKIFLATACCYNQLTRCCQLDKVTPKMNSFLAGILMMF